MAPKLYMIPPSPPVRAVLMTAETLGIELDLQQLDMFGQQQHKSPEYIKMNPQHTVPLLDDDGYLLADSHAINAYLVQKYGKDDSLYPKDLKKRGKVDERLHFDNGTLFRRLISCLGPLMLDGATSIPEKSRDDLIEAYGILEKFLEASQWVAGDELSIADFSIYATASAADVLVPIDATKYQKLSEWMKRVGSLPAALGAVSDGLNVFRAFVSSKLKQ